MYNSIKKKFSNFIIIDVNDNIFINPTVLKKYRMLNFFHVNMVTFLGFIFIYSYIYMLYLLYYKNQCDSYGRVLCFSSDFGYDLSLHNNCKISEKLFVLKNFSFSIAFIFLCVLIIISFYIHIVKDYMGVNANLYRCKVSFFLSCIFLDSFGFLIIYFVLIFTIYILHLYIYVLENNSLCISRFVSFYFFNLEISFYRLPINRIIDIDVESKYLFFLVDLAHDCYIKDHFLNTSEILDLDISEVEKMIHFYINNKYFVDYNTNNNQYLDFIDFIYTSIEWYYKNFHHPEFQTFIKNN